MKPARTSQGERYAMNETINIVRLRQPDEIDDPLTDVLRTGARKLLAQAIEMEAEAFLAEMKDRGGSVCLNNWYKWNFCLTLA